MKSFKKKYKEIIEEEESQNRRVRITSTKHNYHFHKKRPYMYKWYSILL